MSDDDIRMECLRLATRDFGAMRDVRFILQRAERYAAFVLCQSDVTARERTIREDFARCWAAVDADGIFNPKNVVTVDGRRSGDGSPVPRVPAAPPAAEGDC